MEYVVVQRPEDFRGLLFRYFGQGFRVQYEDRTDYYRDVVLKKGDHRILVTWKR